MIIASLLSGRTLTMAAVACVMLLTLCLASPATQSSSTNSEGRLIIPLGKTPAEVEGFSRTWPLTRTYSGDRRLSTTHREENVHRVVVILPDGQHYELWSQGTSIWQSKGQIRGVTIYPLESIAPLDVAVAELDKLLRDLEIKPTGRAAWAMNLLKEHVPRQGKIPEREVRINGKVVEMKNPQPFISPGEKGRMPLGDTGMLTLEVARVIGSVDDYFIRLKFAVSQEWRAQHPPAEAPTVPASQPAGEETLTDESP